MPRKQSAYVNRSFISTNMTTLLFYNDTIRKLSAFRQLTNLQSAHPAFNTKRALMTAGWFLVLSQFLHNYSCRLATIKFTVACLGLCRFNRSVPYSSFQRTQQILNRRDKLFSWIWCRRKLARICWKICAIREIVLL